MRQQERLCYLKQDVYLEKCFLNLWFVSSCPLLIRHHQCDVDIRQLNQCLQKIRKRLKEIIEGQS